MTFRDSLLDDPFHLNRFVDAQASTFETALAELQAGRKRTHWIWFIFPQLCGLGHSAMAQYYGISSFAEAVSYMEHDVLGPRLLTCTQAVLTSDAPSLRALLGSPDDLKFKSSMTLFAVVWGNQHSEFGEALDRWCDGKHDTATLDLLA